MPKGSPHTITGSDGAGAFTQTVDGTTLMPSFTASATPNWSVTVRAHNSVGVGSLVDRGRTLRRVGGSYVPSGHPASKGRPGSSRSMTRGAWSDGVGFPFRASRSISVQTTRGTSALEIKR